MGLDIVSNVMAQTASNSLSINEANMQSSLQKLSSGYQINKAADNASGLVISQHLQAQIGGFQQAQANTQSAINVVQTADGALNEVGAILQRINTLAVESANTSATDTTAQQAAQAEVSQSLQSLVNIAQTTVYGNNQLLVNGTASTVGYAFQVGADNTSYSQVAFSVTAINLANLGLVDTSLAGASGSGIGSITAAGLPVGSTYGVQVSNLSTAGVISGTVNSFTAASSLTFDVAVNGGTAVTVTINTGAVNATTIAAAVSTALNGANLGTAVTLTSSATTFGITDATGGAAGSIVITGAAANLASLGLTAGTFGGTSSFSIANGTYTGSVVVSSAQDTAGGTLNIGSGGTTFAVNLSGPLSATSFTATADYGNGASLNTVNFSVTASNAITSINSAITTVSGIRGTLGAYQNELQHITNNESVMIQNLTASNAAIQDTNMASQMVKFTQDQVLVQAGVSMLAQANQIPQMVMKLLP